MADGDGEVMSTSMARTTSRSDVAKGGEVEVGERTKRKHTYVDDVADEEEEEDEEDDEEEEEEEEEEVEVRRIARVRCMRTDPTCSRAVRVPSFHLCFVRAVASWVGTCASST